MNGTRIGRWSESLARRMRDRTGGTLVLVAGAMLGLLAMAALAVDMSAAFAWRAEAQKIADASSLAGASSYMDFQPNEATPAAEARAYEYALAHTIKGEPVDSSEVTVQVINDSLKVRVGINRPDMPVWFARVLGFAGIDIGAVAAAAAEPAGAAQCLKPWAVPDLWDEVGPPSGTGQDANGDNVWQEGEGWDYEPGVDDYTRYEGPDPEGDYHPDDATGYGSTLRDAENDWGRAVLLKYTDPTSEFGFEPSIFFPWRLPLDDDQEACPSGKGGGGKGGQSQGAAVYRQNICSCNESPIELFTDYQVQTGNMVGPTFQGVDDLVAQDPTARWNESLDGGRGGIERLNPETNQFEPVGLGSPRVIKLALMDPGEIDGSGMQNIQFNNFAMMFLEGQDNNQSAVMARFLFFASGQESGVGNATGSLVKLIRLVE